MVLILFVAFTGSIWIVGGLEGLLPSAIGRIPHQVFAFKVFLLSELYYLEIEINQQIEKKKKIFLPHTPVNISVKHNSLTPTILLILALIE